MKLNSAPTATVTVAVEATGGNSQDDVTFSPASLTFTTSNWNVNQPVTINAAEDEDGGDEANAAIIRFAMTSSDTNYGGTNSTATINIDDDEEQGLELRLDDSSGALVSGTLSVDEGESQVVAVRLMSQPTANVTVALSTSGYGLNITPASLSFTTSTWDGFQTFTVAVPSDDDGRPVDGAVIANPSGGDYDRVANSTIQVTGDENETVGIVVSKAALYLTEGGTAGTFTIRLAASPSTSQGVRVQLRRKRDPNGLDTGSGTGSNIINPCNTSEETEPITVASSPQFTAGDGVAPAPGGCSIQFTQTTWNTDHTITITPGQETDAANLSDLITRYVLRTQGTSVAPSRAPEYDSSSLWEHVDLEILDDDVPQMIVSKGSDVQNGRSFSLVLDEGTTQVYNVRLSSDPGAAGATFTPSKATGDSPDVSFSPTSLTFTGGSGGNFGTNQQLSIVTTKDDDSDADSATVTLTLASSASPKTFSDKTRTVNVSVTELNRLGILATDASDVELTSPLMLVEPDDPTDALTSETFRVKLGSQPSAEVTVTLSVESADAGEITLSQSTLTFTTTDWNTPQNVTATPIRDNDGSDETAKIILRSAGGDYEGLMGEVNVNVTDEDSASATVGSPSRDVISEGAGSINTSDFTVVLGLEPSENVTVTLSAGAHANAVSLDGDILTTGLQNTLTFTSVTASAADISSGRCTTEWNCPQTVRVRGVEDGDTDDETVTITLTGSGATEYSAAGGFAFGSATVSVRDNDTPGVTISPTSLRVLEGAGARATQTFQIMLNTLPVSGVVMALTNSDTSGDPAVTISPTTLTFTTTDATTPQTVTVVATDDADANSESLTITTDITTGPMNYTDLADSTVSVEVVDDDSAGVELSTQLLDLVEGGAAKTFTVQLKTQPSANVTATLTSSDTGAVAVDTDAATGGNQPTISFSTVTATPADISGGSCSTEWNCPQTVTVSPVDDDDVLSENGVMISFAFAGAPEYTSLSTASRVTVRVDDDDGGQLTLSKTTVPLLTESTTISGAVNTDTFTVRLSQQPSESVTVVLSSSDSAVSISPTLLTFTGGAAGDWSTPQNVTLTGANDFDAVSESNVEINLRTSGSADYSGVTRQLIVTSVTDDDTAEINTSGVTSTGIELRENGSGTSFGVYLNSEPNGEVTVAVGTSLAGVASVSPSSLTFSAGDWRAPKSVTVSPVHDPNAVDETFDITLDASGADYGSVVQETVSVKIIDSHEAGFTLSVDSLTVNEVGTGTFDVSLAALPASAGNVQVTLVQPSNTDVTLDVDTSTTGNQNTLTFSRSNWNTPQTVTVSAGRDDDASDDTARIVLNAAYTPSDPSDPTDYATSENVTGQLIVTVTDPDTAALTISKTAVEVTEGEADPDDVTNDQFTVQLATQPISDVLVTLQQPTTTDVRVDVDLLTGGNQNTLSFSTGKTTAFNPCVPVNAWNCPRTVTVSALDDDDATDNETADIILNAAGGDYGTLTDSTVAVTVKEDDKRGFVFSSENVPVNEADGIGTIFTVALEALPVGGSVTATLAQKTPVNSDVSFSPASLLFTTSNWNIHQEVTVRAADDADIEDDTATIEFSATGADYGSQGLHADAKKEVDITVTDDDKAGWDVKRGSTKLGASDTIQLKEVDSSSDPDYSMKSTTLTVRLVQQPDMTVTAELNTGGDTAISFTDTNGNAVTELQFTTTNWDTAQSVIVVAASDPNADDEEVTVTVTGKSGSGNYTGITDGGIFKVAVEDDETAGVVVGDSQSPSITEATLDEGVSATFTVKLVSPPTEDVTVTLSQLGTTNSDVTVDTDSATGGNQNTLTFTSSNWNTTQNIVVASAHDDNAVDETVRFSLDPSTASGNTEYDFITARIFEVSIEDDETAALVLSPVSGVLNLKEDPDEDTSGNLFTVKLASEPTQDVIVRIVQPTNPDIVGDVDSNTLGLQTRLLFSTSKATDLATCTNEWDCPRTVNVVLYQDSDALDESGVISLMALGGDYDNKSATVTVNVEDDEEAAIVLTPESLTVGEGRTETLRVSLATQPSGSVTITVGTPTNADLTVDTDPQLPNRQNTLSFDASNWNVLKSVTITAAEDSDNSPETGQVTFSASGADYVGIDKNASISIWDNDRPGLDVSSILRVGEGQSVSFDVRLNTEPSGGDVTVTLTQPVNTDVTIDANADAAGNQEQLVFTSDNWNVARSVTVSAGHDQDAIDDEAIVELRATGADYTIENVMATVEVTVIDDEMIGLRVSSSSLTINEGGSATFTTVLTSRPSGNVTLAVLQAAPGNDDIEVDADPGTGGAQNTLLFTQDNWDTPVVMTVQTQHDDDGENDTTTINLLASGADYGGQSTSVSVTVTDDEEPGVQLTPEQLVIAEASTSSVNVKLRSRPISGSVTVSVNSSSTLLSITGAPMTFTSTDWNQDQTLVLNSTADADGADEDITVTLTTTGTGDYNNLTEELKVTVEDDENDALELVVPPSLLDIGVLEGQREYIEVSLNTTLKEGAQAQVRVISSGPGIAGVDTDDTMEGYQNTLTFTGPDSTAGTPGNWNTPQRVAIIGEEDDNSITSNTTVVLTGVTGSEYAGLTKTVNVTVTDKDTPALYLGGVTTLEVNEGDSVGSTLQVRLNTIPSGSVLVTLAIEDSSVAQIDRRQLTFDSSNWATPQPVSVVAVDDDDGDNERTKINLSAAGAEFNDKNAEISVTVIDDEETGIKVSSASLSINESGSGDFDVRLGSRPNGFITLTLAPVDHSAVRISPSQLIFSPNNWDEYQKIQVFGRQDEDQRDENTEVRITAAGEGYGGERAVVAVAVKDDERAGLVVSIARLELEEKDGEDSSQTFTVVLNSQPSADVRVSMTSSDAGVLSLTPAQLVFTPQNWAIPQQVTVQTLQDDDSVDEDVMIFATADGDGAEHDGAVGRIAVAVTDDDGAELNLSLEALEVNEGGVSTLTVTLATVPSTAVTVSIASGNRALARAAPSELRFDQDSWSRPQTVSVIGIEDEDRQSHDSTLRLTAVGGEYSGVVKEIPMRVVDNDQGTTLKREALAVQSVLEEMGRALLGSSSEVIGRRFDATGIGRKTVAIGSRDVEIGTRGSLGEAFVRLAQHFDAPAPAAERPVDGDHLGWLGNIELRDGRPLRIHQNATNSSSRDPVISGFTYPVDGFGDELTAWARYDRSEFSGLLLPEEDKTLQENLSQKYDGTQGTAWLGFDQRLQNGVLFGVALSQSSGGSDYRVDGYRASMDTRVTVLMPYIQVPMGRGYLRLMLGYGGGDLELLETSGVKSSSDMAIQLFSLGAKFPLARLGQSTTLALTTSVGNSNMKTARAKVTALRELSSTSGRMSLGLELSHDGFGDEWHLSPRFGLNFRQDSGDHSEGNGAELQGALRLSAPGARFSIDAGLRWLGTHAADEYQEWSGSVELQLKSRDNAGRGLTLALGPEWGTLQSGALGEDEVFRPDQNYRGNARGGADRSAMRARAGFGMDFYGGLLTPFAEYSLIGGDYASSRLISGLKYQSGETFEARLFGEQEVSQGLQPRSRIGLELNKRF